VAEISVPLIELKKVAPADIRTTAWDGWYGLDIVYVDRDKLSHNLVLASRSMYERDWWIRGIFMNKGR